MQVYGPQQTLNPEACELALFVLFEEFGVYERGHKDFNMVAFQTRIGV